MKKMKKILFTFGSIATIATPIATVISCGSDVDNTSVGTKTATQTRTDLEFLSRAVRADVAAATPVPVEHVNFDSLLHGNVSRTNEIKNAISSILNGGTTDITFKGKTVNVADYVEADDNQVFMLVKELVAKLAHNYPSTLKGSAPGMIDVPDYNLESMKGSFPRSGRRFVYNENEIPPHPEHTKWEFSFPGLYKEPTVTGFRNLWGKLEAWQLPASFDFEASHGKVTAKIRLVADFGYKLAFKEVYDFDFALPTHIIDFAGLDENTVSITQENTNVDNPNATIHIDPAIKKENMEIDLYDVTGKTKIGSFDAEGNISDLQSGNYMVKVSVKEGAKDFGYMPTVNLQQFITIKQVAISGDGVNATNILSTPILGEQTGAIHIKDGWNAPAHMAFEVYKGNTKMGVLTNQNRTLEDLVSARYKVVPIVDDSHARLADGIVPFFVDVAPENAEAQLIADIAAGKFSMQRKMVTMTFGGGYEYQMPRSVLSLDESVYPGVLSEYQMVFMLENGTPWRTITGTQMASGNEDASWPTYLRSNQKIMIQIQKVSDSSTVATVKLDVIANPNQHDFTFAHHEDTPEEIAAQQAIAEALAGDNSGNGEVAGNTEHSAAQNSDDLGTIAHSFNGHEFQSTLNYDELADLDVSELSMADLGIELNGLPENAHVEFEFDSVSEGKYIYYAFFNNGDADNLEEFGYSYDEDGEIIITVNPLKVAPPLPAQQGTETTTEQNGMRVPEPMAEVPAPQIVAPPDPEPQPEQGVQPPIHEEV